MSRYLPLLFGAAIVFAAIGGAPPVRAIAAGWQFDQDGNFEGWTPDDNIVSPTVSGGYLSFGVTGNDPWLVSAPISVSAAENNVVVVRMRNGTANTSGRIYWATDTDPNLSQAKSRDFPLVADDSGYTDYRVDLRAVSSWSGSITRLRVDPADNPTASGPMSIDSITFELDSTPVPDPSDGDRKPVPHIGAVSRIAIDSSRITVEGSVDDAASLSGRTLELYELAPYQYEHDYEGLPPLATGRGPFGSAAFSFAVDRYEGARDRYYSKFLVVARKSDGADPDPRFVDNPRYANDIQFDASYQYPYPTARSKKGLQVQMVDDAEELGIGHGAINLAFDQLMLKQNLDPPNTVTYRMDGKEYYFNRKYIEAIDAQVKPLSDNGVIINLILILYDSPRPNSALEQLIHPDAARGQGTVYAFNTANAEGVEYVKAAMEFVTERYSRTDQRYGRVAGYIVGNEVDSQWVWQNMGDKTLNQFMDNYERTTRLVYQAARKHYNNARVYISLDHFWNASYGGERTRYYKGRDVIDKMNALSKETGDFPWDVAHHPYPENLFNPETWQDNTATDSFDTVRVTFKNLHILPEYLEQGRLRYEGQPRRIILSEQGFHTPDLSDRSQKLQAAAYAYAYYKVLFNDGIDAFILHRHVDHKQEGGLRLGLWSWDEDRAEPSSPDQKKYIYDVFQKIDTSESLAVTEFAKPIIGITDWRQVAPSFDESRLAVRTPPGLVGTRFIAESARHTAVDSFDTDLGAWEKAENALSIERTTQDSYEGPGALQVDFNELARLWRGAVVKLPSPVDASATPNLSLALKLPAYEPADDYYAKIKVYDGLNSAEGVVALDTQKGWNHVALDLQGWDGIGSIDRIKVWVRSTTNKDWAGTLLVDEVGFSRAVAPASGFSNVDIAATAKRLAIGSDVQVRVTNYDTATLRDVITIEPSDSISFDRSALDVDGLRSGQSRTFTLKVTEYNRPAAGAPVAVRYRYRARTFDRAIRVERDPTGESALPSNVAVLYNYEGDTQGWQPGANVSGVASDTTFLNAPARPRLGRYVLACRCDTAPATEWRTVYVQPEQPLDLSDASQFFYHIDSYGGLPNATYESRVTLYGGAQALSRTVPIGPDTWNEVRLDLSGWAARNSVTRIEISFRASGNDQPWNGQFQVDFVGYEKP